MMKQLKMGLKLIRYTFQIKLNLFLCVVFTAIGLFIEVFSHGTQFFGAFLVSVMSLFPVQFLYNVCTANLAAASPWKKRMQTSVAAVLTFAGNIIVFSLLILVKAAEASAYPQDAAIIWGMLLFTGILQIVLGFFNGLAYKYFALATIMVYIVIFGSGFLMGLGTFALRGTVIETIVTTPAFVIFITYVCIAIGALLQYAMSVAVYKKPLSKWAQGAAMRKYM